MSGMAYRRKSLILSTSLVKKFLLAPRSPSFFPQLSGYIIDNLVSRMLGPSMRATHLHLVSSSTKKKVATGQKVASKQLSAFLKNYVVG
jgi:spore maturation protein SpmA